MMIILYFHLQPQFINHKHESLEQARIIGRVIGMDDSITNEHAKLLKANGFHVRDITE